MSPGNSRLENISSNFWRFVIGAALALVTLIAATAVLWLPDELRRPVVTISGFAALLIFSISLLSLTRVGRALVEELSSFLFLPLARAIRLLIGVEFEASSQFDTAAYKRFTDQQRELLDRMREQKTPKMSDAAEEKIVALFEAALQKQAHLDIQYGLARAVTDRVAFERKTESMEVLQSSIDQIRRAASTVTVRGFLNLIIGIIFAAVALTLLKNSIDLFTPERLSELTGAQAIYLIGIRVSLALVITLVAYFFLLLYRKSLEDVKYYQNEITDISSRLAAISIIQSLSKPDLMEGAISKLMEIDRNSANRPNSKYNDGIGEKIGLEIIKKIPSNS